MARPAPPPDTTSATAPSDFLVLGAGVVGLATAYELMKRHPDCRITVLEKEDRVAAHQTGRNSGVLHSGIYYKPGSLKASHCREGKRLLEEFCARHQVPMDICGKVIVAVDESERERLDRILQRGQANGVRCELIDADRLKELEPQARGVQAIHVPEAGIVDYRRVCEVLAALLTSNPENRVVLKAKVVGMRRQGGMTIVPTTQGEFLARHVINCTGLYTDRVCRKFGLDPQAKIVPFRGEYFELIPERRSLCRNLIYPVPDPAFPFLGVHFTRMIDGSVECGPNAVLAFAREGYHKTSLNLRDLFESLTYPGFLRLSTRHWRQGLGEMWRSFSKRAFVRALQRLMPEIQAADLVPAPSGVRAQALLPQGDLVDDFLILKGDGLTSVNNAPSPAATASLRIAQTVADAVDDQTRR